MSTHDKSAQASRQKKTGEAGKFGELAKSRPTPANLGGTSAGVGDMSTFSPVGEVETIDPMGYDGKTVPIDLGGGHTYDASTGCVGDIYVQRGEDGRVAITEGFMTSDDYFEIRNTIFDPELGIRQTPSTQQIDFLNSSSASYDIGQAHEEYLRTFTTTERVPVTEPEPQVVSRADRTPTVIATGKDSANVTYERYADFSTKYIDNDGTVSWVGRNGGLHRDGDLPAMTKPGGVEVYAFEGKKHRHPFDGPAEIFGQTDEGEKVAYFMHNELISKSNLERDYGVTDDRAISTPDEWSRLERQTGIR